MNLNSVKTVAVIGLSDKPDRPSYQVAQYLSTHGYKIIPVNPNVTSVLGQKSYPSIINIPSRIHLDVVNIFRSSDQIIFTINQVISTGRRPTIWIQEKFDHPEIKALAQKYNLEIVVGICLMKYHQSTVS